jgi:hypothetical protein
VGGHGHIRHEGWVTEEDAMRRAACLEDPAQLDVAKKHRGIDGFKPGDKAPHCGDLATRITDPDAFATAFARGTSHPDVQAALNSSFDPEIQPRPVRVPIAGLLCTDGHTYCTGWQLEPIDGSIKTARDNRREWRTAQAGGRRPDTPEPAVRPVRTFEGGNIIFIIGSNREQDGYEVVGMYPDPARDGRRPHG